MTVLKGEGMVSILYGSTRLPVGRNLPAYLSRPDAAGSHPTVVVAHGAAGLTASVKAVCRRLARFGFAAICPDLLRGEPASVEATEGFRRVPEARLRADLRDAYETAAMPGTDWADPGRLAVVGLVEGALAAAAAAAAVHAGGVGLLAPALGDPDRFSPLSRTGVRVLAIMGGVGADRAALEGVRSRMPASEWVIYTGLAVDFADESAPGFDHDAAEDAWRRMIEFLTSTTAVSRAGL